MTAVTLPTVAEPIIRKYSPDDLPDVLEVLRSALGETALLKRTPELWNWKHEDNPFGKSLVVVAEVGGELAGVRAMMRWDLLTTSGQTLRCLRPVDTATHPKFERRGIFKQLTLAAIEQATADGIDMIFNTPNASSGPGYLKMGWNEVAPVGVMVRPLLRRGGKVSESEPPDPSDFFTTHLEVPGTAVQPIDRPPLGLRTPRTMDYIKWRFSAHPTARYRQLTHEGKVAFLRPNVRSSRKEIVISDLLGGSSAGLIQRIARVSRAAYLAAWFSPTTAERRDVVRGGLIPVPGVRALTLMARPLRDLPVDVYDIDAWDIALGDLELL